MRKIFSSLLLAAVAAFISAGQANASPITTLYNTGVDNSHAVLSDLSPDTHWSVGSAGTVARDSSGGYPIVPDGPWLANDTLSAWVIPDNTDHAGDAPPGFYDFQTTFSLNGFIPSTAMITGQYSSDNELVDLLVNGTSTGINNGTPFNDIGAYRFWWPLPAITNLFHSGNNTLEFIVHNDGDSINPVGFRAELTGTASPVPEPSSFALLGLGGISLAIGAYRRRRATAV